MAYVKRPATEDKFLIDKLAEGKKPRVIAAEIGTTYETVRKRITRYVKTSGCATLEQAIAQRTADRIRRDLPLALQNQVDIILRKKS